MDDQVVEFNVGGVFYATTLGTVRREPGRLAEMFAQGKHFHIYFSSDFSTPVFVNSNYTGNPTHFSLQIISIIFTAERNNHNNSWLYRKKERLQSNKICCSRNRLGNINKWIESEWCCFVCILKVASKVCSVMTGHKKNFIYYADDMRKISRQNAHNNDILL